MFRTVSVFAYISISAALALSPLWLRSLVLMSYPPEDTFGSGGDVFVWFLGVLVCLAILIGVQFNTPFDKAKVVGWLSICSELVGRDGVDD